MDNKLIAISAKSGGGKDTLGMAIEWISSKHVQYIWKDNFELYVKDSFSYPHNDKHLKIVKFATKLKQMCSLILNVPIEKFENREFKESMLPLCWSKLINTTTHAYYDILDGDCIQDITVTIPLTVRQFMRQVATQLRAIHPDFWINGLFSNYTPESNWIITDLRYQNEADYIRSKGGLIVRINRANNPYPKSNHISETDLDNYKFDMVVNNDGSLEDLLEAAKTIVNGS